MDEIRRRRIEGELRDLVAGLIIGGQVKDPRVGPFVSVTRVEAARDLSNAKIFVSVLPGTVVEGEQGMVFVADRGIKEGFELGERMKGLFS